jgi:hypothetical protein
LNYDKILHGFNLLMREPVSRAIHIPNDRGDLGRLGAVNGHAQRAIGRAQQDECTKVETNEGDDGEDLDENNDEESEVSVNEEMHFVGAGDVSYEFDIFADFVDPSLIDYIASRVSEGSTLNMLSHIVRTICDGKVSMSNVSVISCFERERDAFGAKKIPRCWGFVLKKLDVPELSSSCRNMCKNGHHVWRHLPTNMFKLHEHDKCPLCEHPRFQKVRGMLKPVRVLFYAVLGYCISDLFLEPSWAVS